MAGKTSTSSRLVLGGGCGAGRPAGLNSPQAGGAVDDWLRGLAAHSDGLPIELGSGLERQKLTFAPSPNADVVVLLAPRFLFGSELFEEISYCTRAPSMCLRGSQSLA